MIPRQEGLSTAPGEPERCFPLAQRTVFLHRLLTFKTTKIHSWHREMQFHQVVLNLAGSKGVFL